jgi:CheY-like chemotaxis protein
MPTGLSQDSSGLKDEAVRNCLRNPSFIGVYPGFYPVQFSKVRWYRTCLFLLQRAGMSQTRVVGKRILLVEDERWVRECIKRLLWLDAHTVTEAANGLEAIELFERSTFDIVLTDLDMPKMAGDELVANIRSRAPAQPIVMITAGVERLTSHENPADAVLGKPFGVQELRDTLASLFE